MSDLTPPTSPPVPSPLLTSDRPTAKLRFGKFPWAWTGVACVLLATSAVVQAWQNRKHSEERNYVESCPFPISTLPKQIGVWRLLPEGDLKLDSLTMRITGGTDYILRNYVDDLTGVSLVVLVLFGPAEPVLPHTPEVCYPASGFTKVDETLEREVKFDEKQTANFRSAIYQKPGGRSFVREEVYYSFRLDGQWSPDIAKGRKFPRRNPGVFKVQVQRRVAEGERRDRDEPIEQFLSTLLPMIEKEIRQEKPSPKPAI